MATILGTAGDDDFENTLLGTSESDEIFGFEGQDALIGFEGDDTLDGGSGGSDGAIYRNDPAGIDANLTTGIVLDGYGDTDILFGIERIYGSLFNDTLTGGSGIDNLLLSGRNGDDILVSDNPFRWSELYGGTGNDVITVLAGNAFLGPGAGEDIVTGSSQDDDVSILIYYFAALSTEPAPASGVVVTFGSEHVGSAIDFAGDTDIFVNIDAAHGTALADSFTGAEGAQSFTGLQGNDSFDGGAGTDRVDYSRSGYAGAAQGVSVDLEAGTAVDPFGDSDNLTSIEDILGTDFGDTIIGDSRDNSFEGRDGNDSLFGQDGSDVLSGGRGNDSLDGGAGTRDVADYEGDPAGITASLITGTVTDGFGDTDTLVDVERIFGTPFADTLDAGGFDGAFVFGRGGNDTLSGNNPGFESVMFGGDGNDTVTLVAGTTFTELGAGSDTFNGLDTGTDYSSTISYYFDSRDLDPLTTSGIVVTFSAPNILSVVDFAGDTDTLSFVSELRGTIFDDSFTGGESRSRFSGLAGEDTFTAGIGRTIVDYRAENYSGSVQGVSVNLALGTATDTFGDTDTLNGNLEVWGSNFADTLTGDDNDNRFEGRDGNDTLIGAGGDDRLWAHGGDDSVDGGDGNDDLAGDDGNDTLNGDGGDDYIAGYDGNDILNGGDGRDQLDGGAGDDTLDGGAGDDDEARYQNAFSGVTANLTSGAASDGDGGTDTLIGIEDLRGSEHDDTLTGDGNNNQLRGAEGDDSLSGLGGDDDLRGGRGNDTLEGGEGRDDLRGGEGNDTLDGGAGDRDEARYDRDPGAVTGNLTAGLITDGWGNTDTLIGIEEISGSDFDDVLLGATGMQSELRGRDGDDSLTGADDDFETGLRGGAGNDTLDAGLGGGWMAPGSGTDTVIGGADDEGYFSIEYLFEARDDNATNGIMVVFSTERDGTVTDYAGGIDTFTGIDRAEGTMFADTFTGSDGDQDFRGHGGDDFFDGGSGDRDRIDYSRPREEFGTIGGVNVNMATGTATDPYGDTDTFTNIEYIRGTGFDDTMIGSAAADHFEGSGGNDTLDGGAGDRDEARYGGDPGGIVVNLETGTATDGWGDTDTLTGIENVRGSGFSDSITGDAQENFLRGAEGDDLLSGLDGNDLLFGGRGADTILGGDGNDDLQGGAGDDTLDGGAGDGDTVIYENAKQAVTVNLTTGLASDEYGDTDTLIGIERAFGGDFDDVMVGGTGVQTDLFGGNGNDSLTAVFDEFFTGLHGGSGDDTLTSGTGDVFFGPGSGSDTLVGNVFGAGFVNVGYDYDAFFDNALTGLTVTYSAERDGTILDYSGGIDTFTGIDQINGTMLADSFVGTEGNQQFAGRGGNDSFDGGAGDRDIVAYNFGNAFFGTLQGVVVDLATGTATDEYGDSDTLIGIEDIQGSDMDDVIAGDGAANILLSNGGNDTVSGGAGDDVIDGGDGDDVLSAGAGSDVLVGGTGVDTFVIAQGDAQVFIADFESGIDIIDLTGFSEQDGLAAFNSAVQGSAILTFSDGTVLTIAGVTPDSLSLADFRFVESGGNTDPGGSVGITGTAEQGETVTADISLLSDADGIRPETLVYRWQRDGMDIPGATATSYQVTSDDVGTALTVVVSYTDEGGTTERVSSSTVVPQAMPLTITGDDTPENLTGEAGDDAISGLGGSDTLAGQAGDDTLDGGVGDDVLLAGPGNDVLTGGEGADTFVIAPGDDQVRITDFEIGLDSIDLTGFSLEAGQAALSNAASGSAILTFSDGTVLTIDGVTPETLLTDDFAFGDPAPVNSPPGGTVSISGPAELGETVTADISLLSDADGIRPETLAYQWQRDGVDIPGAGAASYQVTSDDVGTALSVLVSYTDEGGTVEQIPSSAVIPIATGQIVQGGSGSDPLTGGSGDDTISGAGGDDTLTGQAGDDVLDGGDGVDTAVFSGDQASYTLTLSPGGTTLEDRRGDGNGTDMLNDVEILDFDVDFLDPSSDKPFDLRQFGGPTGLSEADFKSFIELYIAYFNRAPDAVGLNFWGTAFANGRALETIAADFGPQPETQAAYPPGTSNTVFATTVYNNVLGRVPDQDGLDFWVGVLDGGSVGRDTFILEVLRGVKADPPPGASQAFIDQQMVDAAYLANKTDIGAYFAVIKGMSDVADASAAMALFDGSEASITAAVAAIDTFHTEALDPDTGGFLMPLVGVLDDPFV